MKLRTKDKIYSLLWNMGTYIEQVKKHGKVNGKPIYPHDLVKANRDIKYIRRLYKDIRKIGYKNYRITREELLELNALYTQYKIDLDTHPQYTPPSVADRLQDI
jgi:hypothetical protein